MLLKPNVTRVQLPRRTLSDGEELKAWLSEVEEMLVEKLKSGPITF